jgi:hypothetical protein
MRNSTRLLYPEVYEQLDRIARQRRKIKKAEDKKLVRLEKLKSENERLKSVIKKLDDAKDLIKRDKITFEQYKKILDNT